MMSTLHDMKAQFAEAVNETAGVNTFMRDIAELINQLVTSDLVTERLEEAMGQLDIAGYNYAYGRYDLDIERHPQRLVLGTEGRPNALDEIWPIVQRHPQVIGEFSWTAWEYIGEAGLGADKPEKEGFFGSYPWRHSMTATLDITGWRRPISYWQETVWGLRNTPYIAVHRPDAPAKDDLKASLYTWSDSVDSWSWPAHEGSPITVEVYSDADEVELLLNGESVGTAPAGQSNRFMAVFETTYAPGELVAVAYRDGTETGRALLRTAAADDVRLAASPDRHVIRADDTDLAYVDLTVCDADGNVHVSRDETVTVSVTGAGTLQGLGSGDPRSEDDYTAASCRTHLGRALAVVRPTGPGEITVRVESESAGLAEATVRAE